MCCRLGVVDAAAFEALGYIEVHGGSCPRREVPAYAGHIIVVAAFDGVFKT
jgi:hypothetical protein